MSIIVSRKAKLLARLAAAKGITEIGGLQSYLRGRFSLRSYYLSILEVRESGIHKALDGIDTQVGALRAGAIQYHINQLEEEKTMVRKTSSKAAEVEEEAPKKKVAKKAEGNGEIITVKDLAEELDVKGLQIRQFLRKENIEPNENNRYRLSSKDAQRVRSHFAAAAED